MSKTSDEIKKYTKNFSLKGLKNVEFGLAVPFPYLKDMKRICKIGAQNVCAYENVANTGETSALMLKDCKAEFCLVGHSERRKMGEKDEEINSKIKLLLAQKITPVLCVGESEDDFENSKTKVVLKSQITKALKGVSVENLIIAYEPVWAIGTGKTPSSKQICENIAFIKKFMKTKFDIMPKVLYGGSVNSKNAAELLSDDIVDGALVGGASLEPQEFIEIGERITKWN